VPILVLSEKDAQPPEEPVLPSVRIRDDFSLKSLLFALSIDFILFGVDSNELFFSASR